MPRPAAPTSQQRALHQHDLLANGVRRLMQVAAPRPGTLVWEPGAGAGAITLALLTAGCRVTAVEIDRDRAASLRRAAQAADLATNLDLMVGDLRRTPLPRQPGWQLIGNPPFMLTAALLRRILLEAEPLPEAMTLVLHREAAAKWAAPAGQGTRSAILAQLCGSPRCAATLANNATMPASHVPLCLWTWQRHDQAPGPDERQAVDRLLETAFAGPHSMREALRSVATGPILRRQGRMHGWDPEDHPRRLTAPAWLALARFLRSIGRL